MTSARRTDPAMQSVRRRRSRRRPLYRARCRASAHEATAATTSAEPEAPPLEYGSPCRPGCQVAVPQGVLLRHERPAWSGAVRQPFERPEVVQVGRSRLIPPVEAHLLISGQACHHKTAERAVGEWLRGGVVEGAAGQVSLASMSCANAAVSCSASTARSRFRCGRVCRPSSASTPQPPATQNSQLAGPSGRPSPRSAACQSGRLPVDHCCLVRQPASGRLAACCNGEDEGYGRPACVPPQRLDRPCPPGARSSITYQTAHVTGKRTPLSKHKSGRCPRCAAPIAVTATSNSQMAATSTNSVARALIEAACSPHR